MRLCYSFGLSAPPYFVLVLWFPVHSFRKKVLRDSMLGCRSSFTMEALEEVERNSPLLSPSSTKFVVPSPGNRQALPGPCLSLLPRYFSSSAPCCSREHDAAWDVTLGHVLFCGWGTASHQHCTQLLSYPVDCTELCREKRESRKRNNSEREISSGTVHMEKIMMWSSLLPESKFQRCEQELSLWIGMCKQKLPRGGQVLQNV